MRKKKGEFTNQRNKEGQKEGQTKICILTHLNICNEKGTQ